MKVRGHRLSTGTVFRRLGILAFACLAGLIFAWLHHDQAERLQRQQREYLQRMLAQTRGAIDAVLHQVDHGLFLLSRMGGEPLDLRRIRERLALYQGSLPDYLQAAVLLRDENGNILASSPPSYLVTAGIPLHLLSRPNSPVSGPGNIATPRATFLLLHHPMVNRQGGRYLTAILNLDQLVQQTLPTPNSDPNRLFLLDSYGEQIYPNRHQVRAASIQSLRELRTEISGDSSGWHELPDPPWENRPAVGSSSHLAVPGANWSIAVFTGRIDPSKALWWATGAVLAGLFLLWWYGWRTPASAPAPARKDSGSPDQIKHLQEELTGARLRSRQLLDHAADALLFIDPGNGVILEHNEPARALLGYGARELASMHFLQLASFDHQEPVIALLTKVKEQHLAELRSVRLQHRDGTRVPVSIRARLGHLDHRPVIHAVLRDITADIQLEEELLKKNRDLQLVNQIAHATAGGQDLQSVLAISLDMVVTALQAGGGGIYLLRHEGRSLHLAAHRNIPEPILSELENLPPQQGLVGRVVTTSKPVSSVNLQQDQRLWLRSVVDAGWSGFQAVPLATQERTLGVLFLFSQTRRVFARDEVALLVSIGKQVGRTIEGAELIEALSWQNRLTRASNRELEFSRQQLRESLQRQETVNLTMGRLEIMKNRFLAVASHELRTPLTYILSGSELLLQQLNNLEERHRRVLDMVHQGGERLRRIVDDLFEVARLEAEDLYLGRRAVTARELVVAVAQRFESSLRERRLDFRFDIDTSLPPLYGDPDHLGRTLDRLVENAIKFTAEGGSIGLDATLVPDAELLQRRSLLEPFAPRFFLQPLQPSYLQLTVHDTGIGIAHDELHTIFDKFHAGGDISQHFSSRRDFGGKGVGLGLTLARGMAEAHDGMLWVESAGEQAGGSRFHLLIPIAAPNGVAA